MVVARVLGLVSLVALACCVARAQDDFGIEQRMNVNVGAIITAPLNPSARFVNIGWGLTLGSGYNFSLSHAVVGEFMWNKLYPTDAALEPVQFAFQRPQIAAYSNLFATTASYRYEPHGVLHGVYFIGGGGWYHRNASVKNQVAIGPAVPCDPAWLWWGYTCKSGFVTTGLGPSVYQSNSLGVNAGIGLTVQLHEASYRFYVETRYHYAPNLTFNTQVLNVTLGFRY